MKNENLNKANNFLYLYNRIKDEYKKNKKFSIYEFPYFISKENNDNNMVWVTVFGDDNSVSFKTSKYKMNLIQEEIAYFELRYDHIIHIGSDKLEILVIKKIKKALNDVYPNCDELINETCPNCDEEMAFYWDYESNGYQVLCLNCGKRVMLCTVCPDVNACSYDSQTQSCCHTRESKKKVTVYIPVTYEYFGVIEAEVEVDDGLSEKSIKSEAIKKAYDNIEEIIEESPLPDKHDYVDCSMKLSGPIEECMSMSNLY